MEAEYILDIDISPQRSDVNTLIPLLDKISEHHSGKLPARLIADAGYESEENYTWLEDHQITSCIKPSNHEKSRQRKYRNNAYLAANMPYDPITNTYKCPGGKKIQAIYSGYRKSISGYRSRYTAYQAD